MVSVLQGFGESAQIELQDSGLTQWARRPLVGYGCKDLSPRILIRIGQRMSPFAGALTTLIIKEVRLETMRTNSSNEGEH